MPAGGETLAFSVRGLCSPGLMLQIIFDHMNFLYDYLNNKITSHQKYIYGLLKNTEIRKYALYSPKKIEAIDIRCLRPSKIST